MTRIWGARPAHSHGREIYGTLLNLANVLGAGEGVSPSRTFLGHRSTRIYTDKTNVVACAKGALSAKGAMSFLAWAAPQDDGDPKAPALKARFTASICSIDRGIETRFQRWGVFGQSNPLGVAEG